jgi:hypothetical protein
MNASTSRYQRATAVMTALVAALLLGGCSGSSHDKSAASAPLGHQVSFQVDGSGNADLSYSTGATATSGTAPHTALPWKKTVRANGATYTLTVVLGQAGGDASCSISVDGRRLAGSSAHGHFGRATCATGSSRADG